MEVICSPELIVESSHVKLTMNTWTKTTKGIFRAFKKGIISLEVIYSSRPDSKTLSEVFLELLKKESIFSLRLILEPCHVCR